MANINQKSVPVIVPEPPSSLISIDETIDGIGKKALSAAQQTEELERSKREAAVKSSGNPIKAAT